MFLDLEAERNLKKQGLLSFKILKSVATRLSIIDIRFTITTVKPLLIKQSNLLSRYAFLSFIKFNFCKHAKKPTLLKIEKVYIDVENGKLPLQLILEKFVR